MRDESEQCTGLAHLASKSGLERERARLASDVLRPSEIPASKMGDSPGEQGTNSLLNAGRLLRGRREGTFVNGNCRPRRADPEVRAEAVTEALELTNDFAPITGVERRLHRRALGFLVGWIDRQYPLPETRDLQHPDVQLVQPLAGFLRPVRIPIIRE